MSNAAQATALTIRGDAFGTFEGGDTTRFSPAQLWIYEWTDYWVDAPGAQELHARPHCFPPLYPGAETFRVRFENTLGRSHLQPYAQGRPVGPGLSLEVLSKKYPTPAAHLQLLRTLTQDLAQLSATFPYAPTAPTSIGAARATPIRSPLFLLHFLLQQGEALTTACTLVRAQPHQSLRQYSELLDLALVSSAGPDTLLDVLHHPERWHPAPHLPIARALRGFAPQQVQQHRSEQTLDTPENRFVLAFLLELTRAAGQLTHQPWWTDLPPARQATVQHVLAALRQTSNFLVREGVRAQQVLPQQSRVLMRCEGYNTLYRLWQEFRRARHPMLDHAQDAIDVRNIAQLYEMWSFYQLVHQLHTALNVTPELRLRHSPTEGLGYGTSAHFEGHGTLVYNDQPPSYALPLRPDYLWYQGGRPTVAVDAKFRFEGVTALESEGVNPRGTTFKADDLYKMHAYRDALQLVAAVIVYPGSTSRFYDTAPATRPPPTLIDILRGDRPGVGAFAMPPHLGEP